MATVGKDLLKVIRLLSEDELVAIPTETVYGLAGNALSESAVAKIYSVKNRPTFNPLIVHVASMDQLANYVQSIPQIAYDLAEKFWPGPLTLILNKSSLVPDSTTSGLGQVAIRIPDHSLTLELLKMLPFPLAAPSANPFGYISPTMVEHVQLQLGNKIPYILDGGPCNRGIESTIVGFDEDAPIIYRPGAIAVEDIKKFYPQAKVLTKPSEKPLAPGMLAHHYSPATPFLLLDNIRDFLLSNKKYKKVGIISFNGKYTSNENVRCEELSVSGNLKEAARNLYLAMHQLDSSDLDVILIERLPDFGVGIAMNNRLERASTKL